MTNWLTYGNDTLDDCFIAAVANVLNTQDGTVVPEGTVRKAFNHWFGSQSNGNAFFDLLHVMITGLHGKRIRSWGTLARTESELTWALDRYKGFVAGLNGAHEVAVVRNDQNQVVYVSVGVEYPVVWKDFIPQLDRGTFAISKTFDPILLLCALKNNPMWWGLGALIGFMGAYMKGLI